MNFIILTRVPFLLKSRRLAVRRGFNIVKAQFSFRLNYRAVEKGNMDSLHQPNKEKFHAS